MTNTPRSQSEHAIRGTFCDLATKLDGNLSKRLIEVKAVVNRAQGSARQEQAVDYAANQGVDWVLLTNGPESADLQADLRETDRCGAGGLDRLLAD